MNLGTQPLVGEVVAMNSLPGSHFPSVVRVSSQKWKPPPKLKPPQNDRPAPRSTMTLTAWSSVASWTAASSSSVIGGTIVFSASGRFSVIEAIAPVDVVEQGLVLAHAQSLSMCSDVVPRDMCTLRGRRVAISAVTRSSSVVSSW